MDIHKSSSTNFPVLDIQTSIYLTRDIITAYRWNKDNTYVQNISMLLANCWPHEAMWAYLRCADHVIYQTNNEKAIEIALEWCMRAYTVEQKYIKSTRSFYKIIELYCSIFTEKSKLLMFINNSAYQTTHPQSFYDALAMTYGLHHDFDSFHNLLQEVRSLDLDIGKILSRFINEVRNWVKYNDTPVSPEQISPFLSLLESVAPNHRGVIKYKEFFSHARYEKVRDSWPANNQIWSSPKGYKWACILTAHSGDTEWETLLENLERKLREIEGMSDADAIFYWYRSLINRKNKDFISRIKESLVVHPFLLVNPKVLYSLRVCIGQVSDNITEETRYWKKLAKNDIENSDYYNYELLRIYIKIQNIDIILQFIKKVDFFKNSRLDSWIIFQCTVSIIKLWLKEPVSKIIDNMKEGPQKEMLLLILKVQDEPVNQKKLQYVIAFISRIDIIFTVPIATELIHLCSGFLTQEHPIYQSILENYEQLKERTLAATAKKEVPEIPEVPLMSSSYSIWNTIYKPRPIDSLAKEVASPGWDE